MKTRQRNELILLLQVGNQMIDQALVSIQPDFAALTNLVCKGHESLASLSESLAGQMNEIIRELQFFDVFKQKFDHIQEVHRIIIDALSDVRIGTLGSDSKTNLIRLNALQFKLAILDYLSAVNHIQTCLTQNDLFKVLGVADVNELFRNSSELLSVNRRMTEWFDLAELQFANDASVGLSTRIPLMEQLYSTESERMVLRAYSSNPLLSDDDLHPLKEEGNTEIDLF